MYAALQLKFYYFICFFCGCCDRTAFKTQNVDSKLSTLFSVRHKNGFANSWYFVFFLEYLLLDHLRMSSIKEIEHCFKLGLRCPYSKNDHESNHALHDDETKQQKKNTATTKTKHFENETHIDNKKEQHKKSSYRKRSRKKNIKRCNEKQNRYCLIRS